MCVWSRCVVNLAGSFRWNCSPVLSYPTDSLSSRQTKGHINIWSPSLPMCLFFCVSFFRFWQPARTSCYWSGSPNHPKKSLILETNRTIVQFDLDEDHLFLSDQGSAVRICTVLFFLKSQNVWNNKAGVKGPCMCLTLWLFSILIYYLL